MNLMPLVAWARSASYDVVGILLPGFIISVLVFTLFIPVITHYVPLTESLEQVGPALSRLQSSFVLVFVFSYLAGFILKATGDLLTDTRWLKQRFFSSGFIAKRYRLPADYSEENQRLYELTVHLINQHFTDNPVVSTLKRDSENAHPKKSDGQWHMFYTLATTLLELRQSPTKIITYQNRYELTKSLGVGFIALGILSALLLVVTAAAPWHGAPMWLLCIVLFYYLALICRNLHVKYWQYLGDELIVSTYVILSDTNLASSLENKSSNPGS